jgi:uncharacterized protein with NAD-binding domain and iron-sulfur cluster
LVSKPIKVAILGGGCSSIAAAFELSRPEHRGKYQITVYQIGWRLGGKGASGRGPADRIEEHGLHIWMGSYENAFRMVRECYAELNRDPERYRIADWRDAFSPAPFLAVTQQDSRDSWLSFMSYFPPADGLPGDPLTDTNPFTITSYLVRTAGLVRTLLLTIQSRRTGDSSGDEAGTDRRGWTGESSNRPAEEVIKGLTRLLKFGLLATVAGLVEAAGLLEMAFRSFPLYPDNLIAKLVETAATSSRRQLELIVGDDPELNWCWVVIDLALSSILGVLRFGLITDPRGFDAINDYDVREWLRLNGASERSLNSALLRGAYDLAFAYEDGDYSRPRHAAGVGLRGTLRMLFSARGSLFWKMRAGMGDIVFAPLYEVLKNRGVSFEFFHRLRNLKLADPAKQLPGEGPYVEALEFDVQARVKRGAEYQPLVEIRGLPCWPSKPDFSQLVGGKRLEREKWDFESNWKSNKVAARTLRVGVDFDVVVFGLGLGAVPCTCKEILDRDQRWRDMVAQVKTVATQAFQIWMREDMQALGWDYPPVCLAGFAQPFDTWADMGHLIGQETWPTEPRAIAYFVSVLSESAAKERYGSEGYTAARRLDVRTNAIRFLNSDIGQLWPKAIGSKGDFRWELLMDPYQKHTSPPAKADKSLFDTQYWIANVDPSERYILSLPGTIRYRISPLDNTYDNLTITGDWTSCGFDVGCVEAAVMSGKLAAHAISSFPRMEDIIAYDHP